MLKHQRPLFPALALLLAAAGCSGNHTLPIASQAPTTPSAPSSAKKAKAQVRVLIPAAPRHAGRRRLRPFFVASSTQGIQVVVYAHGADTTPIGQIEVNVSGGSSICAPISGGRSCTFDVPARAGSDDFVVTTYDGPPSGSGFGSAKELARGTTTATIVLGQSNGIHVTVGGIVAKAAVQLAKSSVPAIDDDSQIATVSALDADDNAIVSDGWWDANGNAVTMTVTSSDTSPVSIGIAPSSVSFAAPTTTLTYSSKQATPTQIHAGFTATITATPSNAAVPGGAQLTLAAPTVTEFPIASGNEPQGIIAGPDGAIWFADSGGSSIGRIATDAAPGTSPTLYQTKDSNAGPVELATGPDGNIWFTERNLGKIASINPSTDVATAGVLSKGGAASGPWGIAAGPDSNMWFVEQCSSAIGRFSPSSPSTTMTDFPTKSSMVQPQNIATGPDGRLWFTETASSVNAIGAMTTTGTASEFPVTPTQTIYQGGIASGPDGAIWFSECNNTANTGNRIGSITTSGSISQYNPLATSQSNPVGIVTGPDGAMWFTENGNNAIGRIDPATHTVEEFTLPAPTPPLTGRSPYGIVLGPDGALWFTECDGNSIGRLQ